MAGGGRAATRFRLLAVSIEGRELRPKRRSGVLEQGRLFLSDQQMRLVHPHQQLLKVTTHPYSVLPRSSLDTRTRVDTHVDTHTHTNELPLIG